MFASLYRKFRQLVNDRVLRSWLIGRLFRQWSGEPAFETHRPAYLRSNLPYAREDASGEFRQRVSARPNLSIQLYLAGFDFDLERDKISDAFAHTFDDIETHLSLHRFAWLPAQGVDVDPDWVDAIWSNWVEAYGVVDGSWIWHPYTASERAINILRFARAYGWPGNQAAFRQLLSAHAENIVRKLEYFGDHHTSNHLANNGRGLYLLGLWLNLENAREIGLTILLEEAKRIFMPSGMLREGSSHYHLLLAINYNEVRTEAKLAGRPEHLELGKIADAALAQVKRLCLPGGVPLIGDISPDMSPDRVLSQIPDVSAEPIEFTSVDGWTRFDQGPWSSLWHVAPEGWSQMPGHGHQDLGGFELHYDDEPVFVDLGRGAYGEQGEASRYRSAMMHNTITLDDQDPYPPNRPYYDDKFRTSIGGTGPEISKEGDLVALAYTALGSYLHERTWQFGAAKMSLRDKITGSGSHKITRRFHTSLLPAAIDGGVLLSGKHEFQILCPGAVIKINPVTRWLAYGRGVRAYQIEISLLSQLPFSGEIRVEVGADVR